MAQQIVDRDLGAGRLQDHAAARLGDSDLPLGQRWKKHGDRIAQDESALFDYHHDGYRDDRLGHGVDAEDIVPLHGRAARRAAAVGFPMGDLPFAGDQRYCARQLARSNVCAHRLADRFQPFAGQAHALGRREGQRPRVARGLSLRLRAHGSPLHGDVRIHRASRLLDDRLQDKALDEPAIADAHGRNPHMKMPINCSWGSG
jgi:hypothetical protein